MSIQETIARINYLITDLFIKISKSISNRIQSCFSGSSTNNSGTPYAWRIHQYVEMPGGTRMRTTFRIPLMAPGFFVKVLRRHNQEENVPIFQVSSAIV
jgi:hypothetical protein